MGTIYIAGAGMAGLSAALYCAQAGHSVQLFEAANHAGGRCRSFHDPHLDRLIDNGNHLILGGNEAIFQYLRLAGVPQALTPSPDVKFPFIDVETDEIWKIEPSAGKIPWWLLMPSRRIPGTRFKDYLAILNLKNAGPEALLSDYVDPNTPIFDRFWQPLCQAVLNTDAAEGAASLIWLMLSETLMKGAEASRPYFAKDGLSAAMVDPALASLKQHGATLQFGTRLTDVHFDGNRVTAFATKEGIKNLGQDEALVLALPPTEIAELAPQIQTPNEFRAIVNIHYRVERMAILPERAAFFGMIGSTAQWLFHRNDIFSVTVSAADSLAELPANKIAETVWREVANVIGRDKSALPPFRVIKEQRATIAQTPTQNARRPDSRTEWENLFLAGDWTNTGLPATIESAVQSGRKAAELVAF